MSAVTKRLVGDRVVLEPLHPVHEAALADAAEHEDVWRWLTGGAPTREQFAEWFARALREAAAGREIPYATLERATGRALGSTRFLTVRPEHRGVEIGWTWLTPGAWRTGANVEAKLLMLEHAFERLDCLRVEFKTDARNTRSRDALAALPAQLEGIHRHHMVTPYGIRDSAYYSIIASEWPSVRDNLMRRLGQRSERAAQHERLAQG